MEPTGKPKPSGKSPARPEKRNRSGPDGKWSGAANPDGNRTFLPTLEHVAIKWIPANRRRHALTY